MSYPIPVFLQKDWQVHHVLTDVPLLDVWHIPLDDAPPGLTMADLRALLLASDPADLHPAARFLFALREKIGVWLGWDAPDEADSQPPPESYLQRLPDELARASQTPPGERLGPVRVLYQLPDEWLAETINATTHAFIHASLEPGYTLYLAVYAQPTVWWSRYYMALIEPFRQWIVYPALVRFVQQGWRAHYSSV